MVLPDVQNAGQTPDNAKAFSSEAHVYTPDTFYRTTDGKIHLDVDIAGSSVTLPVINVGNEERQVWVAYAHVMENVELAAAARMGLYDRLVSHMRPIMKSLDAGEYVTLVAPPSNKTEELFQELSDDLHAGFGKKLHYVQLIGGFNEQEVASRATSGIVLPCDSVITVARGLHKFIAATKEQATVIRDSRLVIGLDDIVSTETTVNRMTDLRELVGHWGSPMHFFVIGTEAQWDAQGLHYPKQFPQNIHAFFQIPEVVGDLP